MASDKYTVTREDVLSIIESFITKIHQTRRVLLGVSISALVLAPFAIGISAYLITHPSFFVILEEHDEFGVFISILLGAVIVVSGIWLVNGIRQYISLNLWNQRYYKYVKKKSDIDDMIGLKFNLDEQ